MPKGCATMYDTASAWHSLTRLSGLASSGFQCSSSCVYSCKSTRVPLRLSSAFDAFHEACGIWLLSTVAARRVTLQLGHPRYTNLYLALVARSSLYTKSTAAEIAIATLQAAGLDWLLAADDSTPQRFIHDLAVAPHAEDSAPPDAWARLRQAFAAQRGWYYKEFGQHLEAMVRDHGAMAQFRSILKRFDDGRERYEVATLSRGSELVERPYLALLACMTPADMRPLARLGAALWHDGYLARFVFVTPGANVKSLMFARTPIMTARPTVSTTYRKT
jgi:Protein of unknown function (DUF3987)